MTLSAIDGAADVVGAMVTVVVPARDEAAVIGRLVADLAAGRSDPMTLVVVDDASCDGTADLACAAIECYGLEDIGRVIRLATPSGSKAAALAAVPVPASGVVVVLDADARVARDFVGSVRVLGTALAVAQARRRMLTPAPGRRREGFARLLAMLQDGEQAIDHLVARGRLSIGGATEFRGDGMVIRADALAALGGWSPDALCEDLELSTRWYLATGLGIEHPPGLELWEQPVLSVRLLLGQRLRWAEGSIRRDLRLVLPALLDPRVPGRRRLEVGAYAVQALVPWAVLGMAARAWRHPSGSPSGEDCAELGVAARQTLAAVAWGYGLAALMLAWRSQAADPEGADGAENRARPAPLARAQPALDVLGRALRARHRGHVMRLARAIAVTAFTGLWALVLPVAWLRVAVRPGPPEFVRTPHEVPARFSEPGSGPRPPT
jgi:hypothetical protein